MIFMYSFCFYCSVRLGSIVFGTFTLIQSAVCAIFGLIWVNQTTENARNYLNTITEDVNLIFLTSFVNIIKNDPTLYSWLFLLFTIAHITTCVLEIYGSYKLSIKMLYPYLIMEMIRLLLLLSANIFGMMLIKENVLELGVLICSTLAGSFLMLFLFYGWACVYSFIQCLLTIETPTLINDSGGPSSLSVRVNRMPDTKMINYMQFHTPIISTNIGQYYPASNFYMTHRRTSFIVPHY